jgi:predicted nucleic acid-binding protein
MLLLDTDVCVDIARGYPPALEWYDQLPAPAALPGLVVLELLRGCRNMREMQRMRRVLQPFAVHWPTEADCTRAVETYARASLSHNLGMIDVLIAECAIGLSATRCTFDQKHYKAVPGLTTLPPYQKD